MVKRKIPARKHHGVRDPLKQQAERFDKIKDKINNPPTNDQEKISYNLSQLIKAKNLAKKGIVKKRKQIGVEDKPKHVRNKIKPVKRIPQESDESYLKRVNRATTEALKEAEYEKKYGVEIHRNPKTGEVTIKKKPKDEFEELLKRKKNKDAKKQTKPVLDPKVAKEMIKQVLREEKNEKKKDLEEFKRDEIKFGEVVHGPPTFSVLPKKAQKYETVARPGKKDLLLKTIIADSTLKEKANKNKLSIDFKGKRKDLTIGDRNMIEKEREKAIELYRNMRKNKLKQI